jgi:polysaccharide export outer membrane protein
MSGTFNISHRGEVFLPALGAVRVLDLAAGEMQDSLRRAYTRYLRNESVGVTVLRRVGVRGEVEEPNMYYVDLSTTLRDVIARAGGITSDGDARKITIVRDERILAFDRSVVTQYSPLELRSGDQIIVGRKSWFELNSLAIVSTAAIIASLIVPLLQPL